MDVPAGLLVRQALPLASALFLVLTSSIGAVAQDQPSVAQEREPSPRTAQTTSPPAREAARPGRIRQAQHPRGGLGLRVFDLVEGGPGYIAVGGGTPTGLDHQALVWLSDDGLRWQAQPLFGDAALGTMRAVAALPDGGYVAVGHDFEPPTERAELVHAIVWYSSDGFGWQRVPAHESFAGSMMWDVTTTPSGVAAAGCVAGFHCDVGRVWTSADGFTWELVDDIPMAPYAIAANAEGTLVIGGEDDAYDLTGGQASAASSAEDWSVRVFATGDSQVQGAAAYGDGFLLVGSLLSSMSGEIIGSAVQRSRDGIEWEATEPASMQGLSVLDVDTAGEAVAVTGTRLDSKGRVEPAVLWAGDGGSYSPVRLPKKADLSSFSAEDVRLTDDGARLFLSGTRNSRPAIWTTAIE